MNKSSGAKDLYRVLGSIDIPAAARSVLLVGRDPDMETRYVRHIKSSLSPEGSPFAFRITTNSAVEYFGEYNGFDDVDEESSTVDGSQRQKAAGIILSMLSKGSCHSTDVMETCTDAGISEATVKRVKGYLGIKSVRGPDEWHWTL